jgi:hypothetical protein
MKALKQNRATGRHRTYSCYLLSSIELYHKQLCFSAGEAILATGDAAQSSKSILALAYINGASWMLDLQFLGLPECRPHHS